MSYYIYLILIIKKILDFYNVLAQYLRTFHVVESIDKNKLNVYQNIQFHKNIFTYLQNSHVTFLDR